MAETPAPSPAPETSAPAGTEAPVANYADKGDSRTPRLVTRIRQKMGREVDPGDILKSMSEGVDKGRWGSRDWKRAVTRRHLIHRTLRNDAQAWYRGHKAEIDTAYQKWVGDASYSPKEKFQNLATAINEHRESTGASLKGKIEDIDKDPNFQKALGERIDALTARKGRALTVRETVRAKRDLLTSAVQKDLRAEARTVSEGVAKTAAEAAEASAKTAAEAERAKAEHDAMLRDPEFQEMQLDIFHRRGLDTDTVTAEQLSEVKAEATDRYKAVKKEEADKIETTAKTHDSYRSEFLRLTGAGVSPEDARAQALEFAKAKVAQEARDNAEKIAADAKTTSEEGATKQAENAKERQRIMAQPDFQAAFTAELNALIGSGKTPSKEDLKAAQDRAIESFRTQEADSRAKYEGLAVSSGKYSEILAGMLSKPGVIDSLDDNGFDNLNKTAMETAITQIKAQELLDAQTKSASSAESATDATRTATAEAGVVQSPEDVLKGLGLDIDNGQGRELLDAMKADSESAQAIIAKIQQAKTTVAKLVEDAKAGGITLDSKKMFDEAFGNIASDFLDELNMDASDGRTLPERQRIRGMLKILLAAIGIAVVGAAKMAAIEVGHRATKN